MIYIIILICFVIILSFTQMTLNRHYGKISDNPLRKKIVQDVTNLILFLIMFWCQLRTYSSALPLKSLVILTLFMILLLHRGAIKKILFTILDKLRQKIAFSITLSNLLRRSMKNWDIWSSKRMAHNRDCHNKEIYKEHIALTVIFFCKRAVILGLILLGCINIAQMNQPETIKLVVNESEKYLRAFTDLFVLISNAGLVFTCWKFHCDYKAVKNEKSDNDRYLALIRRMVRNEHEI